VVAVPSQVIKARLNRGHWEVLVCWEARSAADATWEPLEQFKETHPDFQLEDELFAGEGGSVMDAFYGRQYMRRCKQAPSQG
jgi:hypothetical protein